MSNAASTTKRPQLRIGMVGAGVIAGVHSLALRMVPLHYAALPVEPRLVAICDVVRPMAENVAAQYGYERVMDDWRAVVESPDVDVVCVCIPPVINEEVVTAAAAAGKHIFCEKPLAMNAESAGRMLEACRSADVLHGIGFPYRWTPAMRTIRQLVQDGALGEIRQFRGTWYLDYASDPNLPLLWRFRKDVAGGGVLVDTGYHLIDDARFLVGEIDSVRGHTARFVDERPLPTTDGPATYDAPDTDGDVEMGQVDVDDAASAIMTFRDGGYGILEATRTTIGRKCSQVVEVYGTKGAAQWSMEAPDEFHVCLSDDEPGTDGMRRVVITPQHPGGRHQLVGVGIGTGMGWFGGQVAMWADFVRSVQEGELPRANFEDGAATAAIVDAIYASDAADGTAVQVNVEALA
jgi:predicted dehydrogenase